MSFGLQVAPGDDLLAVSLKGKIHKEQSVTDFQVLMDPCPEHGSRKALIVTGSWKASF